MSSLPIVAADSDRASEDPHAPDGGVYGNNPPASGGDTLGGAALGSNNPAGGHDAVGPARQAEPISVPSPSTVPSLPTLIRYGHSVTRWHTIPCLHRQTIAEHSWAVAMLISRLFTGSAKDRLALIEAALDHDLIEGEIGDMPRPGRTEEHRRLEVQLSKDMGLREAPKKLEAWLEWADLIEAGLYTLRELNLGNQNYAEISLRIADYLQRSEREIPRELWNFAKETGLL